MSKQQSTLTYTIAAIVAAILLIFSIFFVQSGARIARAATVTSTAYEQRNVMDDLQGSTIDGKPFSLEDYNFDSRKETSVISFVEFCYAFQSNIQTDYGLYIYVYNPKALSIVTDSTLNTINMRAGNDESASFNKYKLQYLNQSVLPGYESLFYKFKIQLSSKQQQAILGAVNSGKRNYRVAEIELLISGKQNATSVAVGNTYSYTGYAAGYGSDTTAESTLKCTYDKSDTLTLKDIGFTAFRPEGTNGKNDYTQDSLHSVYFAVPNSFIAKYGELSAIHVTWLNAILAPSLVTGNIDAYNGILPFLGRKVVGGSWDCKYAYAGAYSISARPPKVYCGYGYNLKDTWEHAENAPGRLFDTLYMMYYSGSGTDSADNYVVSSNSIKNKLLSYTKEYGGELVNGKYSKVLFDSVDEEFTDVNIKREDTFDLTKETISRSWWDKLFGRKGTVTTTPFDGIQAIYPVSTRDLEGTKDGICKRLYIAENDYDNFLRFYQKNYHDSTVYLFRYQVSDYIAEEATLITPNNLKADTNAYFFQETVNLDFDFIDVTFSGNKGEVVIPVAMSPIDNIGASTPPLNPTPEPNNNSRFPWWGWLIVGAIAVVLLILILKPSFIMQKAGGSTTHANKGKATRKTKKK